MKTEKVNFKNSRGKNLVGILHTPEKKTDYIVTIAHGFTSNKDRKRLVDVSNIYAKNNIAYLRFDFCGSGESDRDEITVENQIDDLKSAIKFVKDKGYKKIGLQGESLGGLVSIFAYNKDICTMVLWAPVTKPEKVEPSIVQEGASREELEKKGFIVKKKDGREFVIPKKCFEERENFNREELLGKINCPVLILHGDMDDAVPLEHSKEAVKILKNSKLEIIKGGGHKLDNNEKVFYLSLNWFKKYLI